ncbi:hypothetical protein ANTRET_LOCUS1342 [Anthophora retusa]
MEDDDTAKASVAATKIQANFRGYRVRKRLKKTRNDEKIKCLDTRNNRGKNKRHRSEEKEEGSSSVSNEEKTRESLEEKSAVIIQAQVRGYLVRKKNQPIRVERLQAEFNQDDFEALQLEGNAQEISHQG